MMMVMMCCWLHCCYVSFEACDCFFFDVVSDESRNPLPEVSDVVSCEPGELVWGYIIL